MRFESYDDKNIHGLNDLLKSGNHVFILVYMDGCMPCNLMKPNWHNLRNLMDEKEKGREDVSIVDVEKEYLPQIESIGEIDGFPTIKYVNSSTEKPESYQGSRETDDLIKWIKSKIENEEPMNTNNELVSIESIAKPSESPKDKGLISIEDIESSSKKSARRKSSKRKASQQKGGKRRKTKKGKKSKKTKKRRKWSLKYKKSINCKKPKGFSQKQYCKYKK